MQKSVNMYFIRRFIAIIIIFSMLIVFANMFMAFANVLRIEDELSVFTTLPRFANYLDSLAGLEHDSDAFSLTMNIMVSVLLGILGGICFHGSKVVRWMAVMSVMSLWTSMDMLYNLDWHRCDLPEEESGPTTVAEPCTIDWHTVIIAVTWVVVTPV